MSQSYTASLGIEPFNWKEFFKKNLDDITDKDMIAAVQAAREWPTCACGEQDVEIERDIEGKPTDHRLAALGGSFVSAMTGAAQYDLDAWAQAQAIFADIKRRAARLMHP